jgi:hypothetical protein
MARFESIQEARPMMNVNAVKCWECGEYFERSRGVCECKITRAREAERKPGPDIVHLKVGTDFELGNNFDRKPYNEPELKHLSADEIVEAIKRSGLLAAGAGVYGPNNLPPCAHSCPLNFDSSWVLTPKGTYTYHVRTNQEFVLKFVLLQPSGPIRIERIGVGTIYLYEGGTFDKDTLLQFTREVVSTPSIGITLSVHNPSDKSVWFNGVAGGDKPERSDSWERW